MRRLICVLTALIVNPLVAAEFELGGYYKNIFLSSRTLELLAPSEPYLLDLNRLRVILDSRLNDKLSFNVQYDNEVWLGSYLDTTQFSATKDLQPDTYFNLNSTYVDSNKLYGTQRLYRAYVDLALPEVDLRIGRQRIAWGTAMLWNPMDILNPFSPTQLERQERLGIDALLLDWNYDPLSRVSLVYAQQKRSGASTVARWHSNAKGFDLSFIGGRLRDEPLIGFDFAGQINSIGVRGEVTHSGRAAGDSFMQAVAGADYTFANTLSVNMEVYYNGEGAVDKAGYDFSRLITGEVQSLARHYLGGYLGYDITPLLRFDNYLILNLDDGSIFFAPNLIYSLSDNVECTVAAQVFNGDTGTEYGALKDLYYLQLHWFF
ncbi:MAG: hypothetical protein GXP08_11785 [Gammaproteobacteria bacterium]|nr:hypothetical protein [Gammaproteobacteria bacterium]